MQFEKDKLEANSKAEEKLKKIKKNTPLFNKIIQKQLADGDLVDIDLSIYQENEMEECDGGRLSKKNSRTADLSSMLKNKKLGGKRTSPQEEPAIRKEKVKMFECPQCDFLSQNEVFFNEHIVKAHVGQPTCPFCFNGFKDYMTLRKHCETSHYEKKAGKSQTIIPEGRKRPCRYFRNGEGNCSPPSGSCDFDHSVVPNSERQLCFHKQACRYKPNCIFYHPEGQGEDAWQQYRSKVAKICRFAEQGVACMRSVCNFFHPSNMNNLGFPWELHRQPPQPVQKEEEIPSTKNNQGTGMRIPVIVKNFLMKKQDFPELSVRMEGMALD